MHKVELRPSGHTFEVADDKFVLTAGLEAGCNLPYSCRVGMCRSCRAKLIDGKVELTDYLPHVLTPEMQAENMILMCRAHARSDLVIEVQELKLEAIRPRVVPCRVKRIERVAPDIAVIDLRLPQNDNMRFAAGQYIDVLLPNNQRRAYSIATMPRTEGVIDIQLHVRHTPGGLFTDHVFSTMKERDLLRFEGPLGTFYLREETEKPIMMIASGTGFAPIKSMIEHMSSRKMTRPVTLYWGCRARSDLYMNDTVERWTQEYPHMRYVPVLSDVQPGDAWGGRVGFVHQAVLADFADLSGHEVYASGNPAMVDAARTSFTQTRGLPEAAFFADAFLTEADRAGAVASSTAGEPAHI
jgi:CDP-4-dehydro-6-deoxyglucose reductase